MLQDLWDQMKRRYMRRAVPATERKQRNGMEKPGRSLLHILAAHELLQTPISTP